jgi:hypothetical protein
MANFNKFVERVDKILDNPDYLLALGDVGLRPLSAGHASGVNSVDSGGKDLTLGTGEPDSGTEDSFAGGSNRT